MGRVIGYVPNSGEDSGKRNSDSEAPGGKGSQTKGQEKDQTKKEKGQGEPR